MKLYFCKELHTRMNRFISLELFSTLDITSVCVSLNHSERMLYRLYPSSPSMQSQCGGLEIVGNRGKCLSDGVISDDFGIYHIFLIDNFQKTMKPIV